MDNYNLPIKQKGTVIIITFLILIVLLLLGSYFLTFILTELRISKSQEVGAKTYYLAEAGINEVIWKLKNNTNNWKNNFETNSTWSDNLSREFPDGSKYEVAVENLERGRAKINATSTLPISGGKFAQRVVRTEVFKAIGSLTTESVLFANSDTEESFLEDVTVHVHNGNIAVRGDLRVEDSTLRVDDDPDPEIQTGLILVGGDYNPWWSSIIASSICSASTCGDFCPTEYCPLSGGNCPCTELSSISPVDFYSDYPTCDSLASYKCKALSAQNQGQCEVEGRDGSGNLLFAISTCIFTQSQFQGLLDGLEPESGETLILKHKTNGTATSIYYVEGGFDLVGGKDLEVQGALVTEGTVNIGTDFSWWDICWSDESHSHLTISHPTNTPSGLLTMGDINFGACSTNISGEPTTLTGLIYSMDEININDISGNFEITGGLIADNFSIHARSYDLYLDSDIIKEGIWGGPEPPGGEPPPFSPIVEIEHWEESY